MIPYAHSPSVRKLSKIATLLLAKNYIVMQSNALEEMRKLVTYLSHSSGVPVPCLPSPHLPHAPPFPLTIPGDSARMPSSLFPRLASNPLLSGASPYPSTSLSLSPSSSLPLSLSLSQSLAQSHSLADPLVSSLEEKVIPSSSQ